MEKKILYFLLILMINLIACREQSDAYKHTGNQKVDNLLKAEDNEVQQDATLDVVENDSLRVDSLAIGTRK